MVSPYNSGNSSPGFRRGNLAARGAIQWATSVGFGSDGSDSAMHILPPKATPISGAGKVRNQRINNNQGFNL